jgi:hypothetical protein
MQLRRRRFLHLVAGAAALPIAARGARAQSPYPTKPVRVLVGFAPGGGNDIAARLISHWLSERLGQQFIVAADRKASADDVRLGLGVPRSATKTAIPTTGTGFEPQRLGL